MASGQPPIAVLVKGYPRLSETFIAQEVLGLEAHGLDLAIWSLRHPTDDTIHPMHRAVRAPVRYLPEYLHRAPWRVLRGLATATRRAGWRALWELFRRDFARDPTRSRIRRLGQAAVLARELDPAVRHLHVHYLHTPASVGRYAAVLSGRSWSVSAHAKDIWTTPAWDLAEKLADPRLTFAATCTAVGATRLRALADVPGKVRLIYHGLDLGRFPRAEPRPPRDGSDADDPVRIVTVGRAVAKKGFGDLLDALAALPADLHWRLAHIGGGELLGSLKAQAQAKGLGGRVVFLGPRAQPDVIALLAEADLFVLPAKEARSGDRDGLPNVIMEAASQELAIVATRFAAIPEFMREGVEGQLVGPGDWSALSNAINLLARDPAGRERLGRAARCRLEAEFDAQPGFDAIAALLAGRSEAAATASEAA